MSVRLPAPLPRLGLPATLLHLDELPTDVAEACRVSGTPVVLTRLDDARLEPVLDATALDVLEASVAAFERALTSAAVGQRLVLG